MVWVCLALVVVAFVISAPGVRVVEHFSRRLGALDTEPLEGQVKFDRRSIPNTGGIGIYLAIALPIAAGIGAVHLIPDLLVRVAPALEAHLGGMREETSRALTLLGSITLLHVLGLIDDRRPMGAMGKLVIMTLPALLVAWPAGPMDTRLLTMADGVAGGAWLSVVVTVLWFVAVTNAMNFIDNMDGLCAGVAAMAGACFLAAALLGGQWFVGATLALVVGASLGFLVWNFPPARVFMGDGGSLVLGFTLAYLTVRTTYLPEGADAGQRWYALLMPVVALAIPLYDMVSVTLVRLSQGKSPFKGDLQHFSHRLTQRGLTGRGAVLVIYGFTLVTGISGVLLVGATPAMAILLGVQVAALLGVLALFEYGSRARGLDG
jgi:UDP-GlcNAc:undecaprenyl-phosphate GlcNAc-1-phosphate transferase